MTNPGWRWAGRLRSLVGLALVSVASCAPLGGAPEDPAPPAAPDVAAGPALVEGDYTDAEISALADLLLRAEEALEEGDPDRAMELAQRVEAEYRTVPGSSEALWVRARALRETGRLQAAEDAVEEYLGALGPEPELAGEPLLFLADLLAEEGERLEAVRVLLEVPDAVPDRVVSEALERLRDEVRAIDRQELESLARTGAPNEALMPPVWNELALRLHLGGEEAEARELAQRSLGVATSGDDVELARAVLEDRVEDHLGPAPVLGALLPATGSPALREFARGIREGIELAVEQARREGLVVRLDVRDDEGNATRAASLMGELTREGVPAVLGPLTEEGLQSAARSDSDALLLSPSARVVPEAAPAAFSLAGVSPEGPERLARFALSSGRRSTVVLHPRLPESQAEARYFAREFEEGGGRVLRTLAYPPETTNFAEVMAQVRAAAPQALALFVPQGQIQVVAPQVTYYGIDTLDVQLYGGGSWTEESVLSEVDPRHTNGMVAVTARPDLETDGEAYEAFVAAYEDHFQRTLRSSAPALGYDAARLVLEAYRRGARTPREVRDVLEGIQDFPGATGRISVQDGRLVRQVRLVRIEDGRLVPLEDDDSGS